MDAAGPAPPIETGASEEALARWTGVYRDALAQLTARVRTATTQLQR